MFQKGKYEMRECKIKDTDCWLLCDKDNWREFYAHVSYDKITDCEKIIESASNGIIPIDYPIWIKKTINLLWYGEYAIGKEPDTIIDMSKVPNLV